MRTYVLWKDEPLIGMVQFRPGTESADVILVSTPELITVNVIILFKRTDRYRERLQTHLLKNPPTPLSSGYFPE